MEYYSSGGVRLAYEIIGHGEVNLVFLNGVAMSISHWKPVIESLKGNYRILLHDFRGQLLSDKPDEEYSLAGHARDLSALMAHAGMESAHIIGTSYGSEVAMEFALLCGEMTESLVLIDGVSELDAVLQTAVESWKFAAQADPVLFYRTLLPWNYSPAYLDENLVKLRKREQAIKYLPEQYFEGFCRLCDAFLKIDLTPRIRNINCPALVLVGELDILKHRGFSEIICREIQQSRLEVMPAAGHAVVIEEFYKVAESVETFLEEIGTGSEAAQFWID